MGLRKASRIFKPVAGFENYEISIDGIVRNIITGKTLVSCNGPQGYKIISLYRNKEKKMLRIHRLVAIAFIPNYENKPDINHIDGNKANNAVNNLEWVTKSENELHSRHILGKRNKGPWKDAYNEKNPNSKSIEQYSTAGKLLQVFPSMSEAGRLGFSVSKISCACSGASKTHKGFIWKLSNNQN